jgi:leucyl aminopeptidase
MKVSVLGKPLGDVVADALVVATCQDGGKLTPALRRLDQKLGGALSRTLEAERFQSKFGQVTHVHTGGVLRADRLVVVGLGPRGEVSADHVRRAAATGVRRARDLGARRVAVDLVGDRLPARHRAHAVTEGALLGTYTFERYKRDKSDRVVEEVLVVASDPPDMRGAAEGARTGEIFGRATNFARDLVNGPANDVHPAHLAEVAREIARDGRLGLRVWERAECEKMGMGAFLGVAAGSEQPPKFIHITYAPAGRSRKRVAIIGKGITFDAGGLDLKTADGMLRMKDDMSGAAAVLAVLRALPDLKARVEVHGIVAAAENMPSGSALRPGDVLRAMNGTTIEIGNTDAEGRLTLADALVYAAKQIEPVEAIDVATLTGAIGTALGPQCAGLFSNDDRLAERLLAAAAGAGERLWRLPLIDDYREHLRSDVADINNVARGVGGGAINAAVFLREFVGPMRWAHLDIAATAFTEKESAIQPKGATGTAVRTLLAYLAAEGEGR